MSAPLACCRKYYTQECPDKQISCDISSDADCRRLRDTTSRACKTTWSKVCCKRECWSDSSSRNRVCKIAPPVEDYFGLYGFADVEGNAGDEESEEFDSEDLATEISADGEDEDSEFEDTDFEDSEDMIFYSGNCSYDGFFWSRSSGRHFEIRTSQDLNECCLDEFDGCKDDKHNGFSVPNCAKQRKQCGKQVRESRPPPPTPRPTPLPIPFPTPPTDQSCRDNYNSKYCRTNFFDEGRCSETLAQTKCRLSCGLCRKCSDISSNCKSLAREGYCESSYDFMKVKCRRTCGLCNRSMEHSEDVISEFEDADAAGNEGLEDVDSGELATATENVANSEGKDSEDTDFEDSEDMSFYPGNCYYGGWTWSNGREIKIRTSQDLNKCCTDEFYGCKDDKRDGFSVPNCARQRKQCGEQDRVVQVA